MKIRRRWSDAKATERHSVDKEESSGSWDAVQTCFGNFSPAMEARNQVGIMVVVPARQPM